MALRLTTTTSVRRDSTLNGPNGPLSSSASQPPTTPASVSLVVPQYSAQSRVLSGLFAISRLRNKGTQLEEDISILEPDELFTRYTVAEVKTIAARLRGEAEAKQEELRLMVGERYRDLLQASTSIIDMSDTSTHVLNTLGRMEEFCSRPDRPSSPLESRAQTKEDAQLQTLQSLSAHLKLLLDCPEHLWRLLENKRYLHAAWLFLLARVVHRSLTGSEDEEQAGWSDQGINVVEQFPLVQRQWDVISPFRTQITHKSTLSLRDHTVVAEETMYSLVPFLLLDSLPLGDSLSLLLAQRNKALHALVETTSSSRSDKTRSAIPYPIGSAPESVTRRGRRKIVREVGDSMRRSVQLLVDTLATCRAIYSTKTGDEPTQSRIHEFLVDMQSDTADSFPITSAALISHLPSAPILTLYLPEQIKSYTPYLDTENLSLPVDVLEKKLGVWFTSGLKVLDTRIADWVKGLINALEVDEVRRSVLDGSTLDVLAPKEREALRVTVESRCVKRMSEVWSSSLQNLQDGFAQGLDGALQTLSKGGPQAEDDIDPSRPLLSPTLQYPSPHRVLTSAASVDASFARFTSSLRRRINYQTPLLDSVLSELNVQASGLWSDLENVATNSATLRSALLEGYSPKADQTCACITDELEKRMKICIDDQQSHSVVFLGRVAHELRSSATFDQRFGATEGGIVAFQKAMTRLHDRSIEVWREAAVASALEKALPATKPKADLYRTSAEDVLHPHRASSHITAALISLARAVNQLGLPPSALQQKSTLPLTIQNFVEGVVKSTSLEDLRWGSSAAQLLWDLVFLETISDEAGVDSSIAQVTESLKAKLSSAAPTPKSLQQLSANISNSVAHSLPKMQLLLAPLLDKPQSDPHSPQKTKTSYTSVAPNVLLSLGVPSQDGQEAFVPALELAKPTQRFGLLLVGSGTR